MDNPTGDATAPRTRRRAERDPELQAKVDARIQAAKVAKAKGEPAPPTVSRSKATGKIEEAKRTKEQISAEAAEKAAKAARLRFQRYSWDYIAKEVGFSSRASAYTAVKKHIEDIPKEAVEDLRRMELESLDEAESALKQTIQEGDPQAIAVMLKVKEQRAKLTGLHDTQSGQIDMTLTKMQIATETARLMKAHPDMSVEAIINEITKR